MGQGWQGLWGHSTTPGLAGGCSPIVLEVGEVVEDVRVRLALGEGEARVCQVPEHLLDVCVDPAGRVGLSQPCPPTPPRAPGTRAQPNLGRRGGEGDRRMGSGLRPDRQCWPHPLCWPAG